MFPRYFGWEVPCETGPKYFIGDTLTRIEHSLRKQVREALLFRDESLSKEEVREQTSKICSDFFYRLPEIQRLLLKDVQAGFRWRPSGAIQRGGHLLLSRFLRNLRLSHCP